MIRLTIDGQGVVVPAGTMIADAAEKLGIDIPVYCYHEALGPLGACRMCFVQVEKMPKLATACTTAVAEGMVVHTSGPAVDKGRKGVLEFLLINHPLDCPVCDKGGECFLQDYTFQYGPPAGRFAEPKIEKLKDAPINEFILIDQERCVLCQRCVRFMGEYVGEEQLLLDGRGVETVVATVDHQPVTSQFSGNVIDLCPVGALLSRPYRYKARPWNIEREQSVCPHCPVGCPTWVTGRDGKIVRTEGRRVPDTDWGWLCDRGRFGYDFAYVPERLTVARQGGQETKAALATREVGQWLRQTVDEYGSDAIGFIIGGMHSVEDAYALSSFAREVVGTEQVAISRSVPGYLPRSLNGTYADIEKADTVLLLGADPYDAVPVIHLKLRDRLLRNPDLRVFGLSGYSMSRDTLAVEDHLIDPKHQAVALALALRAARPNDDVVSELTRQLSAQTLPSLTQEQLRNLGEVLVSSENLVILWDGEVAETEWVLTTLAHLRQAATPVLPAWGPANWRGWEYAGVSADFRKLTGMLEDARDGKIKLLVLWGADIIREYPDQTLAREALQGAQKVVAEAIVAPWEHELVDIVLPGSGWGEELAHYVNMEARIGVANPSVRPPGQARPTKTYLTTWAHAMQKSWMVRDEERLFEEDWVPSDTLTEAFRSLTPVAVDAGRPLLITGDLIIESGLPSEYLRPRVPGAPGRVNPLDAHEWGIVDGDVVTVSREGRAIDVAVHLDARIPQGVVYIPRAVYSSPVNRVGTGMVSVKRREEVSIS